MTGHAAAPNAIEAQHLLFYSRRREPVNQAALGVLINYPGCSNWVG
jgi:hypothetical protein